jgi:hypothetical protein
MKLGHVLSAAVLAAVAMSAAAFALEGGYTMEGQDAVFTFGDDGYFTGMTPDGVMIHEAYQIDGDTITFTAADDHPTCPGAVGVYSFVETETSVRFVLVSDSCEARVAGMTAGAWTKVDE